MISVGGQQIGVSPAPKVIVAGQPRLIVPAQSVTLLSSNGSNSQTVEAKGEGGT